MRFRAVVMLCLLTPLQAFCLGQDYVFSKGCRQAYDELMHLHLKEAARLIEDEKAAQPDNLVPYLLESYRDLLQFYAQEKEVDFVQLKNSKDLRLKKLSSGDQNSPYFRYTQAEVNMHMAFARIMSGEYFTALLELRRAYKLLEENSLRHPNFLPNKKSLATLQVVFGAVPEKYQWGLDLIGVSGNYEAGLQQLKALSNTRQEDFLFKNESALTLSLLLMYLDGQPGKAYQVLESSGMSAKENPLFGYIYGMVALYSRHNEKALEIFDAQAGHCEVVQDMPRHQQYLHGLALLNQLSPLSANYLEKFIAGNKNGRYIKSAYQKLAWQSLIQGDVQKYHHYIQLLRTQGSSDTEADRMALREAESGERPDIDLLKARLLFDGGYYEQALAALESKNTKSTTGQKIKLELTYRKARIYDAMGNATQAKALYERTIREGEKEPYYYAANAALNMGQIYESQGQWADAALYFNKCLHMKEHEYTNSLAQKAKAGLQRLSLLN